MEIHFAYTMSENTKWSISHFTELNERINTSLLNCEINVTDKINTIYVGILYLEERFFDQLKARKPRVSLLKRDMCMEVKIPIENIEWLEIEKLIIHCIVSALKIAVKKKYINDKKIIAILEELL